MSKIWHCTCISGVVLIGSLSSILARCSALAFRCCASKSKFKIDVFSIASSAFVSFFSKPYFSLYLENHLFRHGVRKCLLAFYSILLLAGPQQSSRRSARISTILRRWRSVVEKQRKPARGYIFRIYGMIFRI